jgi:hypothetical protein
MLTHPPQQTASAASSQILNFKQTPTLPSRPDPPLQNNAHLNVEISRIDMARTRDSSQPKC